MPFTASHPAAVLPLLRGRGMVPSALVIGSMAPDVPYFVPLPIGRDLSHSLAGTVTVDLYVGLVLFVAWQAVVAGGVLAIAPAGLRRRLGPRQPAGVRRHLSSARGVGLVLVSLVLGALTHVVWDAFTHSGAWGTDQVAWLRETHGPRPLYRWLQYASGGLGAAVLALAAARWWRTTPPRPGRVGPRPAGRRLALGTWAVIVLAGLVTAAVAAAGPLTSPWGADWRTAAFRGITRGGTAGGAVLLAFALAWAAYLRAGGPLGRSARAGHRS
jgi:hypothetical protein